MTEQEIRQLSNEALIDIFGFASEQRIIREQLVDIDVKYKPGLEKIEKELELMKAELSRRMKRKCLGL